MIVAMADYQAKRRCIVEGCERQHYGHGLCGMHYQRLERHGDVNHLRPQWHGGRRKAHPLYRKWSALKGRASGIDPVWGDFDRFLMDVGDHPQGHALVALTALRPIGPGNFEWRLIGKGLPKPNYKSAKCSCDDCERPVRSIGLCALHYDRWVKRGTLEARTPTGSDPAKFRLKEKRRKLRQYGLTISQYDEMLAGQRARCAMCGGVNANGKPLSVDHDHGTGAVRELLCAPCNTGIGMFNEDEGRLFLAIEYLRRHKRGAA